MSDIYLHLDGQQKGPFQPDQVRQLMAEGKATGDTPAWQEGMSDWSTVSALLPALPAVGAPPVFHPPLPPPAPAPVKQGMSGWVIALIVGAVICIVALPCLAILAGVALGPITNGIKHAKVNMSIQQAHQIGLAMYSYANDNNGTYPDGKTSTEVFQKLLDGGYASDPSIFYVAMPGKTKPTSNHLTAENVCYDVTSGVAADSSDEVPLVFATGYVVTYSANAMAEPDPAAKSAFPGMAVFYKNNMARFLNAQSDGTVPSFISPNFDPGNKIYKQLKP